MSSSPTTALLLAQTRTIPIVFANIIDPVGQGFVKSLSRPGGNATGLINLEVSMAGKWVELLKEVAPRVVRVVVPFNPTSAPYADFYLKYFTSTARSFGVEIIASPVADVAALESFVGGAGARTEYWSRSNAERVYDRAARSLRSLHATTFPPSFQSRVCQGRLFDVVR